MKYRKKPVVIDAFKWTGGIDQEDDPLWIISALMKPFGTEGSARTNGIDDDIYMEIVALGGGCCRVELGDFIIQGVKGEIYPCKPDIFEDTYEKVDDVDGQFC
jgi:hypothetical protein